MFRVALTGRATVRWMIEVEGQAMAMKIILFHFISFVFVFKAH